MTEISRAGPRRGRVRLATPDIGQIHSTASLSVERQVYDLIRKALMSGMFLPGSRLTGRSIAQALGISPTPVRDALKRLEADNIIESRSKSAYFLNQPNREEYVEVYALRLKLEGWAAARAAQSATKSDVKNIASINERYLSASTLRDSIQLNFLFHFEVYKLAKSKLLLDIIEDLWMMIGPSMYLHDQGYSRPQVYQCHSSLVDALRAKDPVAAEHALAMDLKQAVETISPMLRPGPANKLKDLKSHILKDIVSDGGL